MNKTNDDAVRSANIRRIIPVVLLIVNAVIAFVSLALGMKIIALICFFLELIIGIWALVSYNSYMKARDELFAAKWLHKLNDNFSDLTYEPNKWINESCIRHNRCYGDHYLSGLFRQNHFEFSNLDLSIQGSGRNEGSRQKFHGFCIIWTLNRDYDEKTLETIEVKIAKTIDNSIPDYLDDGRLIVHVPRKFVFMDPQNSQRTEEEIALIVRVMSAIEQITSRPEFAHPAKITIPNQKAVLAYQDTNNFINMNNREKL